MAMQRFWLSYDLGVTGQYDELYAWLDQRQAKECGDSVATFVTNSSRKEIIQELKGILDPNRNPRIYLIELHKVGGFILGRRKVAPWTGYAQISLDSGEEQ
jgi:hypothetical protein